MNTDPALVLAQWVSPSFPIGAFAFSHGLETVIASEEVVTAEDVERWISNVLEYASGANDAVFLCHAFHAKDATELSELSDLCIAFCMGSGRKLETVEQGASFARTLRDMYGLTLPDMPYPIAMGRAAALYGLPLDQTVRFYLQGFAANLVSAAVRRVPLGQTDGQRMLASFHPLIARLCEQTQETELDALSSTAFSADIAALQHETLYSKTFRT